MSKKTYEVVAGKFGGHAAGETFEAELDEAQEKRAVARGSLKVVTKAKQGKDETDDA